MTNAFTSSGLFGQMFQDRVVATAFGDAAFMGHMLAFERAWTDALVQTGRVTPTDGKAALEAIDGFLPDFAKISTGADRDGLPVPELVRQLRNGLPDTVQNAIHTGATSQDVIDTAMVLACRDTLQAFEERLHSIDDRLTALLSEFGTKQMMGRTRMQAALPITVGDRLHTWQRPLQDHLGALAPLLEALCRVQIGGPVGLRDDQMAAMSKSVAQRLDLKDSPVWHSQRSAFVSLGHWLVLLSGTLGKIGLDFSLMAQQGIEEVALKGSGGSSAMPHKQNPVRAETLVTLARYIAAQQGALGQVMLHEQERSGAAWALEWMVLPAMLEATGAALNQADAMLENVTRLGPTGD